MFPDNGSPDTATETIRAVGLGLVVLALRKSLFLGDRRDGILPERNCTFDHGIWLIHFKAPSSTSGDYLDPTKVTHSLLRILVISSLCDPP